MRWQKNSERKAQLLVLSGDALCAAGSSTALFWLHRNGMSLHFCSRSSYWPVQDILCFRPTFRLDTHAQLEQVQKSDAWWARYFGECPGFSFLDIILSNSLRHLPDFTPLSSIWNGYLRSGLMRRTNKTMPKAHISTAFRSWIASESLDPFESWVNNSGGLYTGVPCAMLLVTKRQSWAIWFTAEQLSKIC